MVKSFVRSAIAGLMATAVAFGLGACAPSTTTNDGTNLSTSLDPVPLAEKTPLIVTIATKSESFGHFLLALQEGEFEKENLDVQLQIMPQTEAIPAVAQGVTDVAVAGISASFFNAVAGEVGIKMVSPGATQRSGDGLYVRNELLDGAPASLKGKKIGTSAGWSLVASVAIERYLNSGGLSLEDVENVTLPIPDLPGAFIDGQVDAMFGSLPTIAPIIEQNAGTLVAGYGPTESGTSIVFGPNLLIDRPEVGQAFIRALTRTVVTYLSGDYKSDPALVAKIATSLESTPEEIMLTKSVVYPFEFDTQVYTSAQELWIRLGDIVDYDTPLEPDVYIDSSFVDRIDRG